MPPGEDVIFHATWGGTTPSEKEQWYYLDFKDIAEGGTSATGAAGARDNLGVHGCGLLWELIFGD